VPTNGQPRCAGAATVIDRKALACKQFRLVAARPGGLPTALAEASNVADDDLVRAERMPVRAAARRSGDPFAVSRLNQVAQHSTEHMLRRRTRSATYPAGDPAAGAVLTA
jgi:hypothetical protein